MNAHKLQSRSSRCQLRVEQLENRCLLAVMADGMVDPDGQFEHDALAICECAPAVMDQEFSVTTGDASESIEEFAALPGSNGGYEGVLEQPYFVDPVTETGEESAIEVIDVADDEAPERSEAGGEGKGPLEWVDYEDSGPIIYTMMPGDSGETVKGDEPGSSEVEIEDPVIHTMEDVDVVSDSVTPVEPVSEVEDPEIVTFGNDGQAAESSPVVEVAEEVPVVAANRQNRAGRLERDGRNRGIMQLPMLSPGVDPPILAVVTVMDNRGRLHEVQMEVPASDGQASVEPDLEPLDAAFSFLRGGRLSQRLGGLR